MNKEYTCSGCHKTFTTAWSDEEAMQESKEVWGEYSKEDLAVVCDDCYNKVTNNINKELSNRTV